MMCRWHRWLLSGAADARRAPPRATQRHLAACDNCRAFAEFCAGLPRTLAAAPAPDADGAAQRLRQRILARTVRAPVPARRAVPGLVGLGDFLANPWKPALAAAALAAVLLAADLGLHYRDRAQARTTFAALREVQSACDDAVQRGPAAVTGLLDAAAQHVADQARAAVDFLGATLPPAAQPNRS